MGRQGIQEVAELNLHKSRYALEQLLSLKGVTASFHAPTFNEFALRLPEGTDVSKLQDNLLAAGFIAGYDLVGLSGTCGSHADCRDGAKNQRRDRPICTHLGGIAMTHTGPDQKQELLKEHDQALIFELSRPGRIAYSFPSATFLVARWQSFCRIMRCAANLRHYPRYTK